MPYLKPLPQITESNRPFWEALKRREFIVPKCADCGAYNWTPYPACRVCLSERLDWVSVSGRGTLYTFSEVHRGPGAFSVEAPYVVAAVALDEDPNRLVVMGNMVEYDPAELEVGMPVEIVYEDIREENATMWRFRPRRV